MVGIVMAPLAVFFPVIIPQMCPSMEAVGTRLGMASAAAALGVLLGTPLSNALIDIEKGEVCRMEVFNPDPNRIALLSFTARCQAYTYN